MKANREHRVPLCDRAMEILKEARTLGVGGQLVFPSPRGKALSDMTLSKLVKERGDRGRAARLPVELPGLGRGAGTNDPREVVEAALSHTSCRTKSFHRPGLVLYLPR